MKLRNELAIIKDGNYPSVDIFFKSFRKRKNLSIKVKPPKVTNFLEPWLFEIKIISIELLRNNKNLFPDKGSRLYEYKLIGQIISLNNQTLLPKNFFWKEGSIDREIKIYFSTHGAKTLVFRTSEDE